MNSDPEQLADFLDSLEDYSPTIPDELTEYLLRTSGHECKDKRLVRLVSLAAQKFINNIANDALLIHSRKKAAPAKVLTEYGYAAKDKDRWTLTIEDLGEALKEYGINLRKPLYYADNAASATEQ